MHDLSAIFHTCSYSPNLCPILGGVEPTVLFCALCKMLHEQKPRIEVSLAPDELFHQTGLTHREQRIAQRRLVDRGIMSVRTKDGQQYFRIHFDKLETLWQEYKIREQMP